MAEIERCGAYSRPEVPDMNMTCRLTDPNGACKDPKLLRELQDKVSSSMTKMFQKSENGGNPFLFALSAPKPHFLELDEMWEQLGATATAATDGKHYYWAVDFLNRLTTFEIQTVMMHESYHVLFNHVDRGFGKNPRVWGIAIDYVVNSVIEKDHQDQRRKGSLWGGNIGTPLLLRDLLEILDGNKKFPKGICIFADVSQYGRSPESIYDEIMKHLPQCTCAGQGQKQGSGKQGQGQKQGSGKQGQGQQDSRDGDGSGGQSGQDGEGKGKNGDCPIHGDGSVDGMLDKLKTLDGHIKSELTKQEIMQEIMRAAQSAKMMRGTVPSAVEDELGHLLKPELSWQDLVRHAILRKQINAGNLNDWKRFRRRPMQMGLYVPRKYHHKPRWLCMLDTSGSMSDNDMAYIVSQLQVLGDESEGVIVPVDASPKWDAVTNIKRVTDLNKTKIKGRGGTDFNEFFRDFPKKVGTDFDVIIVGTDGEFGTIKAKLRPKCDVVFVISNDQKPNVPFGRVAPLRGQQRK
jgi:predicted metal-dependent peptidase